jgi:hypothetical protein
MGVHIVAQENYDRWNDFTKEGMAALCGVVVQREQGRWTHAWTEYPCKMNPDKVCPECHDHPEYAMILLAGRDLYE